MKDFWNKRYGNKGWAYGKKPNEYFREQLTNYQTGKILLPAEGEGRNAVYAAKLGWDVSAFDLSFEGKAKAFELAKNYGVQIDYKVGELSELIYKENYFDAIALIYAHFPSKVKSAYHKKLDKYLRKGGILIFEAFSKSHLKFSSVNKNAGGPKNVDMLFSTDEIKSDFKNYKIIELVEKEMLLDEGIYHKGKSGVIRFVGRKK